SGHKFGLVYPGLGWVVWKDKKYLPDDMSFTVNYLGAEVTQVGLNYSRPAAQILGQYYQFIRLGFEGYKNVQYNSLQVAEYLKSKVSAMTPFMPYADCKLPNPIFVWRMKPEYQASAKWTLYDLQDKLAQKGWMIPAYTMPANIETMIVMRALCKQGFSRDMADQLIADIEFAVAELEKLEYPTPTRISLEKNIPLKAQVFNHTGK
ncbi:MAG: glutamate decarboxylase, partial [Paramuribaculum sp.]|nr:glutamate decarboxylase [Paramuribaculum sp.]